MGFDFWITLKFEFDTDTGLPLLYKTEDNGNYYRIPEQWRGFIDMWDSHMRYYVQHLDGNSCTMSYFYEHFPSWDTVKKNIQDEDWTEETHNEFEAFAEWCAERGNFYAHWEPS